MCKTFNVKKPVSINSRITSKPIIYNRNIFYTNLFKINYFNSVLALFLANLIGKKDEMTNFFSCLPENSLF